MSSLTNMFILLLSSILATVCCSTRFTIVNRCSFKVFPVMQNDAGTSPNTTGFALPPGESNVLSVPGSWSGRLWGRTYCSHDKNRKFSCLTGDCASSTVECDSGNASPSATFAEFNLNATSSGSDFFRVSVMNGYNLPMMVEPQVGNGVGDCMTASCMVDLNKMCPSELKVMSGGDCIGCRSACQPLSKYCFSEFFAKACSHANANVDATKTFQSVCASTDYRIILCPTSTSSDEPEKEKNPTEKRGGHKKRRPSQKNHNKLIILGVVAALVGAGIAITIAYNIQIIIENIQIIIKKCKINCCNCCNSENNVIVMNQENEEIRNKVQGQANKEVEMVPQVRSKRNVILPTRLNDHVMPTLKKGSRK